MNSKGGRKTKSNLFRGYWQSEYKHHRFCVHPLAKAKQKFWREKGSLSKETFIPETILWKKIANHTATQEKLLEFCTHKPNSIYEANYRFS